MRCDGDGCLQLMGVCVDVVDDGCACADESESDCAGAFLLCVGGMVGVSRMMAAVVSAPVPSIEGDIAVRSQLILFFFHSLLEN